MAPSLDPIKLRSRKIIYSNFLGLAPVASTRTNLQLGQPYHVGSTFAVDMVTNPGLLSPGLTVTTNLDTNSRIAALIQKFVHYDTGSGNIYTFFVENGVKIHRNTSSDGTDTSAGGVFPVSITGSGTHSGHTTFVGQDIIYYRSNIANTPTNTLFISYNDNTDGDLVRMSLDGTTTVQKDFLTGTASGGASLTIHPHPMVAASNGYLYIADGNAIHKFDGGTGTNGTFTADAIDLPAGWAIYDMIEQKGLLWILAIYEGTTPSSNAGALPNRTSAVFKWNFQSTKSSNFSGFESDSPYFLESTAQVSNLFLYQGVPHAICLGSNSQTSIKRFTGSEFSNVWTEPGDITPVRGGICIWNNHILWVASSTGNVYAFGQMAPGYPETFNCIGSTGSASGAVTIGSTGNIWASHNTNKLKLLGGLADGASITTLVKGVPKLSQIHGITVFYTPFSDSTNSTLTLNVYKNFSTTPIAGTYQLTHTADNSRGYKYFPLGGTNWENTSTIRLNMLWSLAGAASSTFIINRVEIEFTPVYKLT